MPADLTRERRWWDAKALREEEDQGDEAINRALRWRELERHLDGVRTILDVGGGTGAFSVPLAKRGYEVTHLDFSPAMLRIAREKARDLPSLRFVEANAVALPFADASFDLVLNMDGAISFCGSGAERALRESCRVASRTLVVAVSNRAWMVPVWVGGCVQILGAIAPAAEAMLTRGEWHQDQFPGNPALTRGMTQDYMPAFHAYTPAELRAILQDEGLRVQRCGGLGSLALLCGQETVGRVLKDEALREAFLDYCERFDEAILPDGPGTRHRAGLLAVAERVRR